MIDLRTVDLEAWLQSRQVSARTRRGLLGDLRTLFAWGIRRGLVVHDITRAIELPRPEGERPVQIHTPGQVRRVLLAAYAQSADVGRHLAVRYFAGVRSAEAHRMREESILPDYIEVTAAQSKTRSRRLIAIQPALRAWLALGGVLRPISPNTIKLAIAASGVPWVHNATRHSFVTYHLAAFGSAGKSALEAGHAEAILFRHYRALATEAVAREFWALRP